MNFSGKEVLISGASSGIGAEFAKQFHALGSQVILIARREQRLQKLTEEFNAVRAKSARYFVVDLGRPDTAFNELVTWIKSNRVDILVNNAGRGSFECFHKLSIEEEIEMVAINVSATLRLAHAVIPQMRERREGAIISVSSIAGFQALPCMATYSSTKAFNLFHSLALRHELSEYGIRVVTLCPGPAETEFKGVARVPGKPTGIFSDKVEQVVGEAIRGLRSNRAIIVPGTRSKLVSIVSRSLPRNFSAWLGGKLVKSSLQKEE